MNEFEQNFQDAYNVLNDQQKQAVDKIDGPVMVLAGPGTGKTQLLSMRVANILRKTDASPENILCLTFTDNSSANMTKRMSDIFGAKGYDVAVHTFHSFATMAMGRYSDYFYRGADFQPADELTKLEIINNILRDLPHTNPLSGTHGDTASNLRNVQSAISNVKRKGGYTSKRLRQICEQNLKFISFAEPIFRETFSNKISAKDIPLYSSGYEKMSAFADKKSSLAIKTINDFADAINDAAQNGKTPSITAFKKKYFNEKKGRMIDRAKTEKTAALGEVYETYQTGLSKRCLYDFDDMIVNMVEQITNSSDFRAELQEQFQYILVDEFQDTNDAQMQILHGLADAPDSNIMVVGDDDQAIYSFQGANLNNLVDFMRNYPDASVIQLFENYRSEAPVLGLANQVIADSSSRVKESFFETLEDLVARREHVDGEKIEYIRAKNSIDEQAWVAENIASELAEDPNREIAIITREHKDLVSLVPYLEREGITNIEYEKRSNVLDSPPIKALETLARIVCYISDGAHAKANSLLPELLAHGALDIPARDVWKLSLDVQNRNNWLETMLEREPFIGLANWLVEASKEIQNITMESAIDLLFEKLYKVFYFSNDKLQSQPERYLEYLTDLITLRDKVSEYKADTPTLKTFVEVLDLYRKYDRKITALREFGDKASVHLMSVHGAKGLEFDSVYVIHGTKDKWLKKGSEKFFPCNFNISAPADYDENLRLIFVAITRAKHRLFISSSKKLSAKSEDLTILPVLGEINVRDVESNSNPAENLALSWNAKYVNVGKELKELLAPQLAVYKLNATAVGSFTNLEYSGPEQFLLNSLLRFPSEKSAKADYGTAVHETMKFAHIFFERNNKKPSEAEIIRELSDELKKMHMLDVDYNYFFGKGSEFLPKFVAQSDFNGYQKVEQVFDATLDDMRLTGKMDLVEIDEKNRTISVYDYKTGNTFSQFNKGEIKSHTYFQQLMFYKLLIENSNNRPGFKVKKGMLYFVEAGDDEPKSIEIDYDQYNMDEFVKLLKAIWDKIQKLDFPDVSEYRKNLAGTLDFERDLVNSKY